MSDEVVVVNHRVETAPNGAYYLNTMVNGNMLGLTFIGNTAESIRGLGDVLFSVAEALEIAEAEAITEVEPVKE